MESLPSDSTILTWDFFERDTATVARELLGKILVSRAGGVTTGGRIVETEAYLGERDPGSHAATKGITKRNAVMYGPPGHAYVYFTYGNHHMLNIVTGPQGVAGAVLIRALEPSIGVDEMLRRKALGSKGAQARPGDTKLVASGPGRLARALGVDLACNATELGRGVLAVYDAETPAEPIGSSGRVGLSNGHELELRFFLVGNPYVSKGRVGPRPPKRKRTGGVQR